MRFRLLIAAFGLLVAACSGSSADDTTTSTVAPTSTAATTTTVAETTTTVATSTTSEATTTTTTTTTTTQPDETTTTTGGEGDTTTTSAGETETTFPPTPTTSSTTIPADAIDPDLVEWEGVFRQPTAYPGFIQFRADGVVRAGTAFDDMPFEGTWDYDDATRAFVFSDFDVGGITCAGAEGRYARDTARGGGRTLTLIEDSCDDRVAFLTLPGSPCQCMTWLEVVEDE